MLSDIPGHTNVLQHEVHTGNSPLVRLPFYQLPEKWREAVEKEIQDLLDGGIVEVSTCAWSSPIVPVN